MYNYKITVRIHNPEKAEEVEVPLYSSLEEAIESQGAVGVLEIVNEHLIRKMRMNIRESIINKIVQGNKK